MNKTAITGLLIALLLPITGYLLLKNASDNNTVMPRKYFKDTIVEAVVKGKTVSDTVWHQTKNIKLQNQLGDSVSLYDIKGKIIVADFFFTRCAGICPRLTRNMSGLQKNFSSYKDGRRSIDTSVVQFLSFSIDPDYDSTHILKKYADRFRANPDNWWFLTGPRRKIYDFIFEEFKVDKYTDEPIDSSFIHTNKYVLLDRNYVVRGFYNGLDTASLVKLQQDIGLLMVEKDKKAPSSVFREIVSLSWLWLLVGFLIIVFILFLISNKKKNK